MKPAEKIPALTVRTGLQAGGAYTCHAYCRQEFDRCQADPRIDNSFCHDRLPVCQNACDVCGATYP